MIEVEKEGWGKVSFSSNCEVGEDTGANKEATPEHVILLGIRVGSSFSEQVLLKHSPWMLNDPVIFFLSFKSALEICL